MHWGLVLKDDLEISHRSKEARAGKHEVTSGGLQAGGGNACRLTVGLAKSVSNCAKIRETKFPEQLRHGRDVGGISVEIPCNEYGALRVHSHLINDGSDDSVGPGSLCWKLGTVGEAIDDIAGKNTRG